MKRSTILIGALTAGIAVMLAITIISKQLRQEPGTGTPTSKESPKTPAEMGGVTAPIVQPQGMPTHNGWVKQGPLQKDIDSSKVTVELEQETHKNFPDFTKHDFTVSTTDVIRLTLRNTTAPELNMKHNWVLAKPNTIEQIDIAAKEAGPNNGWIPNTQDILAHTQMISSGESDSILFKSPDQPGDYPFICTFPGHARNGGVLHVKKAK